MPVYCSFCHTRSDQPVDPGAEEAASHVICHDCVCPKCGAQTGLERIRSETPGPMKLFGALLATAGFLVVVISGLVVVAS